MNAYVTHDGSLPTGAPVQTAQVCDNSLSAYRRPGVSLIKTARASRCTWCDTSAHTDRNCAVQNAFDDYLDMRAGVGAAPRVELHPRPLFDRRYGYASTAPLMYM